MASVHSFNSLRQIIFIVNIFITRILIHGAPIQALVSGGIEANDSKLEKQNSNFREARMFQESKSATSSTLLSDGYYLDHRASEQKEKFSLSEYGSRSLSKQSDYLSKESFPSEESETNFRRTAENTICPGGSLKVRVEVLTGSTGSPTWSIIDNDTLQSKEAASHMENNKLFQTEFCLEYGVYGFTIDRITPSNGGFVKLYSNEVLLFDSCKPLDSKIFGVCTKLDKCEDGFYIGDYEAIVLRVISNDAETNVSKAELEEYFFAKNTVSMSSQFLACSFERFNIQAFDGNTTTGEQVTNGVVEIKVNENSAGVIAGIFVDHVISSANALLGNLQNQFSFIIICLPPGTVIGSTNNWKAYAFVNGKISIYNDRQCSYLSVEMHEIGHNLGLSHSNEEVNYGDETGYMGISYQVLQGPEKCFNGPKSWNLGWYSSRHTVINLKDNLQSDVNYYLGGIADFNPTISLSYVIKLINSDTGYDYYLTFNKATTINEGTGEHKNTVVITKRVAGHYYADSTILATVGHKFKISAFTIYNIDEGKHLRISALVITAFPDLSRISFEKFNSCVSNDDCDDGNACSLDECDTSIGECTFTFMKCYECGAMVGVKVYTNENYDHVLWSIEDASSSKVVRSSGYFEEAETKYNNTKCLEFGKYKYEVSYSSIESSVTPANFSLTVGDFTADQSELLNATIIEVYFTICSLDEECYDYNGCSIDRCDQVNNLCVYTELAEEDCNACSWLSLNITTDNYPEETTWEIRDFIKNDLVFSGNPYPINIYASGRRKAPTKSNGRRKAPTRVSLMTDKSKSLQVLNEDDEDKIIERICLDNQKPYHFKIMDSFGDGICCAEGTGSYHITISNIELKVGGEFFVEEEFFYEVNPSQEDCHYYSLSFYHYYSEISTCVYKRKLCEEYGGVAHVTLRSDKLPFETRWQIKQDNNIYLSGGPYNVVLKEYFSKMCLPYGSYTFEIFDSGENGLTLCEGVICGYYKVMINNVEVVSSDGSFKDSNYHIFGVCNQDEHCDDNDPCTKDACDLNSNTCVFSIRCELCEKQLLTVDITTSIITYELSSDSDRQTTWVLVNNHNDTVLAGGPYSKGNFSYEENCCVSAGSYVFNIFDSYGKGLCGLIDPICNNYTILVNNVLVVEGDGDFQYQQRQSFNVSETVMTDWFMEEKNISFSHHDSDFKIITIEYWLSKGKSIDQFVTQVYDESCTSKSSDNSIIPLQNKIIYDKYSFHDVGLARLELNQTNLRSSEVWRKTSDTTGLISFCVRSELYYHDLALSFIDTKVYFKVNFESNFLFDLVDLDKLRVGEISTKVDFRLESCICDSHSSCVDNPLLKQNSVLRICVFSPENVRVTEFESLVLYQDGIAKHEAIKEGISDPITSVTFDFIGLIQTQITSRFFDDPAPSPVIVKGRAKLDFLRSRRRVLEKNMQEEETVSFELEIYLKPSQSSETLFASFITLFLLVFLSSLYARGGKKKKSAIYSLINSGA